MRLTALILSLCLLLASLPAAVHAESLHTYSSALIEAESGMCIGGTDPDLPLPVGTQTKLMTVLLAAEAVAAGRLTPDSLITAPGNVTAQPGATIWLTPGEKMTVSDLAAGVIVGNANDAAFTLACALGGSEAGFVAQMNDRALSMGLTQTHFADCTGLSAENVSTAHELGLICRAMLRFDWLAPILTTWRCFLRGDKTELVAENTLTRSCEGILGMKAGHGEHSGYTVAAAAERRGLRMIAVVLGCDDPDERFTYAQNLLRSGFSDFYVTTPDFSPEFLQPVTVRHGVESAVLAEPGALCTIAAENGAQISCVLMLPAYIEAPVQRGDRLGTVAFYSGDDYLYETALTAADDVPRRDFRAALRMLLAALTEVSPTD